MSAQTEPLGTPTVPQNPEFAAPPRPLIPAPSEDLITGQGFGAKNQLPTTATDLSNCPTYQRGGGSLCTAAEIRRAQWQRPPEEAVATFRR